MYHSVSSDNHTQSTLTYYNKKASSFTADTQDVDLHHTQDYFLSYLTRGSRILDLGCGAGRDTKYYLEKGYLVDAVDGSAEMCRTASEYAGISVTQMLFQELSAIDLYDGIWACASLLHLSRVELPNMMKKLSDALHEDGILYVSFKYGSFDGFRGERYYSDMTEETLTDLVLHTAEFKIGRMWITSDVRPGRSDEKWLNAILKKQ